MEMYSGSLNNYDNVEENHLLVISFASVVELVFFIYS